MRQHWHVTAGLAALRERAYFERERVTAAYAESDPRAKSPETEAPRRNTPTG